MPTGHEEVRFGMKTGRSRPRSKRRCWPQTDLAVRCSHHSGTLCAHL